jgi:integrase
MIKSCLKSFTFTIKNMNIEERHGLWYAVVMIPKELRSTFDAVKFIQSLRTHNKAEAQLRALPLISRWKAEIKRARGNTSAVSDEALMWKRDLDRASEGDGESDHGTKDSIVDALIERTELIAVIQGDAKATEFYGTAMGTRTPLRPLYDEWKQQLALAPKTMDQMGRDVEKLVTHFVSLEALTPRSVKLWVDGLALAGCTHASLDRNLKACKSLWKYLRRSSVTELDRIDPFVGVMSLITEKVAKNKQGRVAFDPADIAKIYQAALEIKDQPLADIIALGAYTGARINELACLKVMDVTDSESFKITDSKTNAGIREIPIHPALSVLVRRLCRDSNSGYLIPSESANQYGNRGDPLSKRFGRLKNSMGFTKGSEVFHSIRKTIITLMENAGVAEGVAADIVGHEKQTMTYGLYSMGSMLEIKREALSKTRYPAPLADVK